MKNFLLSCYKGFFARIEYDEKNQKWIGYVLNSEDATIVFDGDTLEELLATYHSGINQYNKTAPPFDPHIIHKIQYEQEDSFVDKVHKLLNGEY